MALKNYLLALSLLLGLVPLLHAEKHGLIITIGKYPKSGMWPSISSSNDVELVRSALLHLAFAPDNITHLSDGAATHAGIIAAFEQLTVDVQTGDIVYIHFSGHGQQVVDDNNDEIDNLDEAIVPYDSPMIYEKGVYEGERLLRDDMLNKLTAAIRRKCGPTGQVILVLDSCHSGTGTRGMAKARGSATLMAPSAFRVNTSIIEQSTGLSVTDNSSMAPMASFFGASPRELNYETLDDQSRPVGSLSYAITTVLGTMKDAYTFEELFDRVRTKMKVLAPRQNPQWEGPKDVLLLGGEKLSDRDRHKVSKWLDDASLITEVGTVSGIFAGSQIELVSSDNTRLCTGEVSEAGLTSSTVILTLPCAVDRADLSYIKVTEPSYPQLKARIHHEISADDQWAEAIAYVATLPIYEEVSDNADLYISPTDNGQHLRLTRGDGSLLQVIKYNKVNPSTHKVELQKTLRAFVQAKFLRAFDNPSSSFDFDLSLQIVNCGSGTILDTPQALDLMVGTCIQLQVNNKGVKGGYFSILDIQPDNIINVLCPDVVNGRTADEYYLAAGQTFVSSPPIEIVQPVGEETLKLLASKQPLDLAGIVATQGNHRRGVGAASSFEEFMSASYQVSTRGAKVRKKTGEDIGTSTLYFKIKE